MSQPNINTTTNQPQQQTTQKRPVPAFNQAPRQTPPFKPLTEDRVKELVAEALIEYDLIPKVEKKKAITIEQH